MIKNPTALSRINEIVEIDIHKKISPLPSGRRKAYLVKDRAGKTAVCQVAHDGKLIFAVDVKPKGIAGYTVEIADSVGYPSKVFERIYPERKNDVSNRMAFRLY